MVSSHHLKFVYTATVHGAAILLLMRSSRSALVDLACPFCCLAAHAAERKSKITRAAALRQQRFVRRRRFAASPAVLLTNDAVEVSGEAVDAQISQH